MLLSWVMLSGGVMTPILSIMAIYLFRMGELNKKRLTIPGHVKENLTLRLFVLAGTVLLAGGIFEFVWRREHLRWVPFIIGWLCGIGSFLVRRRAIEALGKFWSLHVEIRDHHEFVRSGPFRWVRHPTYFSMILELLAGGLVLNAWFTLAVVACLFLPTLAYRIKIEEAALVQKFGAAYEDYRKSTPMLILYRIPRSNA